MCGIIGTINYKFNIEFKNALNKLSNRGPDNSGYKEIDNLVLGHTRLSIIDSCDLSNQPFYDNEHVLVYNGEIFNFKDIKMKLVEKYKVNFITASDTEVVFYALKYYKQNALSMFNGMFALAFYDISKKELLLARDSYGKKPLLYFKSSETFIFSSTLSAMMEFKVVNKNKINKEAVVDYLFLGYIPHNRVIIENVKKLQAGECIVIKAATNEIINRFYFASKKYKENNLEKLLLASIKDRLVTDKKIAFFLSGGIDSTLLVALGSKISKKIETFSLGFNGYDEINETKYAKEISKFFNTNHHEVIVDESFLLEKFEEIFDVYDEPFGDPAGFGFYILSTVARKEGIQVAISGDAGDEIFGGYDRYNLMKKISKVPIILLILIKVISQYFKLKGRVSIISNTLEDTYVNILSQFRSNEWSRYFKIERKIPSIFNDLKFNKNNLVYEMKKFDQKNILQDGYLTKLDRASMEASIEVRTPFLDDRIVNLFKQDKNIQQDTTKSILKNLLQTNIPKRFWNRPKQGFFMPFNKWFTNELKNNILSTLKLNEHRIDYINFKYIYTLLDKSSLTRREGRHIFIILSLVKWLEKYNKVV